jgi:hypothetical protein
MVKNNEKTNLGSKLQVVPQEKSRVSSVNVSNVVKFKKATHKKRRLIAMDLQDYIESKVVAGYKAIEIFKDLELFLQKEGKGRVPPEIRTIQRIAQTIKYQDSNDSSGLWSINTINDKDNKPEDARLVLEVLAYEISRKHIFKSYPCFSCTQAKWIIKLRKIAPDAPPRIILLLANICVMKASNNADNFVDVDAYLAFTPWKNRDCKKRYEDAVLTDDTLRVPLYTLLVTVLFEPALSSTYEIENEIGAVKS